MSDLKILIVLFSLFSIFGCSNSENEKNDTQISKEKFIEILVDVNIGDAIINQLHGNSTTPQNKFEAYYEYIYKKHGITREQFNKTLEYYSKNPEVLNEIFKETSSIIEKKSKELDSTTINRK
jgi:hypothetical protein